MQLYNKLSAEERRLFIAEAGIERLTLSFYQYHQVENPQILRDYFFLHWNEMDVLGRIYVAQEGINAQLSVPAPRFDDFKSFLDGIEFLKGVRLNIAVEQDNESFLKSTEQCPREGNPDDGIQCSDVAHVHDSNVRP